MFSVGYQCHWDFLLATLLLPHRRACEVYERNAQRATFLDPVVYMGGAHLAKLGDLPHWPRPEKKSWRALMALASFIDSPCDPIGHANYMRFVIILAGDVTLRAWTTKAQARELLHFADLGVEEDDELASGFLGSVQAGVSLLSPPPTPARRAAPPVLPSDADTAAAITFDEATRNAWDTSKEEIQCILKNARGEDLLNLAETEKPTPAQIFSCSLQKKASLQKL